MALVSDAITYARQKAQTDSNGITDTNGLAWANNGLLDITRDLIERGIDAAQVQESTQTLTSSSATPGRFVWPTDMFALKTIECDYTGIGGANYLQAGKLDVANLQGATSWDYVRANQPTNSPQFTNHGNSGEVFPTPTSSVLVRIYYYLTPTEYTAVGDTIAYPQSLDYRALGDKILIAYYQSLEKFDVANQWEAQYAKKIGASIHILGPQSKQPITPDKLHITGWQY
jgi:hypothetical protein